ncbi:MAG: PD-(D/E)XK nuclease family protein, partial [Mangrovibacterium sp.]|nr:PD-(D/E)XK nuclease family protein [Mangrovibacterium sp.]
MNPFLKQTASFLYRQYGGAMNTISVVFPGRRSGVFFNAYLNDLVEKPLLGPEVLTINELISQVSGLQISDQINLILSLHKIYVRETGHQEELDDFFFWGEVLLNDFNDIDKYLLDAGDLFQNISDLKEIESRFDYL